MTARFMDHQNHERCRKNRNTFTMATKAKSIMNKTAAPKDGVYGNDPCAIVERCDRQMNTIQTRIESQDSQD